MIEDRLDRIEKNMEYLLQSVMELRASQEQIKEHVLEARSLQESETKKRRASRDPQSKPGGQDRLGKTRASAERQFQKTIRNLDRYRRQLVDLGLVEEDKPIDVFSRELAGLFRKRGVTFSTIRRNLQKKGAGRYDIVASTGNTVLVIMAKRNLQVRMVDYLIDRKLPRFKEAFDEYADFEIYGGMGALVVKDDVGRYAERKGLYVLTQTDEGGATLLNRGNFKPKSFG